MVGYVTEQELTDYATERGGTVSGTASVLLTKALDWLELRPFAGEKTDPDQALEFPRDGETSVPEKIKTAQIVAALLIDSGEDLLAPIGQKVTSESVAGAVSVTYSESSPSNTLYPQLNALLRDYLASGGVMSATFEVARG